MLETEKASLETSVAPSPKSPSRQSLKKHNVTIFLLNVASIVEKADEQVLPAVYFYVGKSFGVSLSALANLTFCRAVVQAVTSPISGVLGDKHDRTVIVAFGCALWGVMTALIALSATLEQAMLWACVNGLGLALVIPCVSSLVADYNTSDNRGRAFGLMGFVSATGAMVASIFATNLGGYTPLGIEGWRFAFYVIAAVSLATALLVRAFAVDPRHALEYTSLDTKDPLPAGESTEGKGSQRTLQVLQSFLASFFDDDVKRVLSVQTFQIIILQGIVGTMPWMSMSFLTLWLQLLGFSDMAASTLVAIFSMGCAVGGLIGGALGDYMTRMNPNHGRIYVCQTSIILGLPTSFLVFKGLPWPGSGATEETSLFLLYTGILVMFGLTISWCGANNSAFFADVVPEHLRSKIYAFDRAFEGAIGACGLPLVGIAAEQWFGFERDMTLVTSALDKSRNASALSNALLVCLVLPWSLCFMFYMGLHWSYGKDRRLATSKSVKEQSV